MPNRILRQDILTSDRVARLSWAAECFYRRLMSVVDDYGRFDGRLSVLRTYMYPVQIDKVSERDVGKWRLETVEAGLVTLYVVKGKEYVQIERFGQRTRTDSKFPSPAQARESCAQMTANVRKCPQMSANDGLVVSGVGGVFGVEGEDVSDSTKPQKTADSVPEHYVFRTHGEVKEWVLSPEFASEISAAFPALNIDQEIRKAQLWLSADDSRRKTARGMKKFISGWMGRAQDKHKPQQLQFGQPEKPTGAAKLPPSTIVPEFIMLWDDANTHAGLDRWFQAQTRLAKTPENRRKIHSLRNYHARKLDGADPDGKKTANNLHSDVKAWWQGRDFADMTNRDDWEAADAVIAGLEAESC